MIVADFLSTFFNVIIALLALRLLQAHLKPGPTDNAIAFLLH